jgi:GT2 family glycosyltransferase
MTAAQAYAQRYLRPVPERRPAPDGDVASLALEGRHFVAPAPASSGLTLHALYVAGALCGHAESLAELGRRCAIADGEHDELQALRDHASGDPARAGLDLLAARRDLDALRASARAADDELARARSRAREIETSTTWRLSAPLRAAMHGAKLAKARAATQWRATRQLPRYMGVAMTVLRNDGPVALVRRAARKLRGGHRFVPRATRTYRIETRIAPLSVPASASPAVSIVIAAYGDPLLTYTCLASIAMHTAGSYEVIVVDDASPQPLAAALAEIRGVRFERNGVNAGFVETCNRGAALARGDTIVLLNNDTIVTAGWLDALLRVFAAFPLAGLVGARLVYPDGRLQEAGGIVWRDGSAWNVGRDDDPDRPEFGYLREVDYCSGACLAVPRDLWNRIGGFDTRYAPAYYEDTDLAFAVRAAGRRVYYQPRATVVHFEGQTSGTDVAHGIKRHQALNQATFAAKWSEALRTHQPNGVDAAVAKDRWAERRMLVVDACMLRPDQDSGSLRMQALLEIATSLRCKVTFVADNLEYQQPYVQALQDAGVEVLFHPYVRSIAELLMKRGREFDVVMLSRHYIAAQHVETVRRFAPAAAVVFDTVDLHFLREERLAALDGGRAAQISARAKRDEELRLIAKVDVTLVVSDAEQTVLKSLAPASRVMLLSNVHELSASVAPWAARSGIVFIGGFQHPPNVDAVIWYAREILPLVQARLPGVTTYIIGSQAPASVKALAGEHLVILGHVPHVEPYFDGCRVSIAPLRYGAGVKGKVNLAMSRGVPVIATTAAIEGMHLVDGVDVLAADDAVSFADALKRAYDDEQLWNQLSAGGRANIERHFSRDVARQAMRELLAVAGQPLRRPLPSP